MAKKTESRAKKTLGKKEMKGIKGGGKVQISDLSITKVTDKASTNLF